MRPGLRSFSVFSVAALGLLSLSVQDASAQLVVTTPRVSVGIGTPYPTVVTPVVPPPAVVTPMVPVAPVYVPTTRPYYRPRYYPRPYPGPRLYGPYGGGYRGYRGGYRPW